MLRNTYAGVAQSVEQRTRNAKVVGSIPISGTNTLHTYTRATLMCFPLSPFPFPLFRQAPANQAL